MPTLQEQIDNIRAATNRDGEGDAGISDAQLTTWIVEDIEELRASLLRSCPDEYCGNGTFTLSGTNAVAVNTVVGSAGFLGIRSVEYDQNNNASARAWVPLDEWRFSTRGRYGRTWRVYGAPTGQTLHIEPESPAGAADGTYRLWFITKPAVLTYPANAATVLELPAVGGAKYVTESVAARVRVRLDEDPTPHLQAKQAALMATKFYYADRVLRPSRIEDVEGLVDDDMDWWP